MYAAGYFLVQMAFPRHLVNQSEGKAKTKTRPAAQDFSRFASAVFCKSFDWFTELPMPFVIGRVIYLTGFTILSLKPL